MTNIKTKQCPKDSSVMIFIGNTTKEIDNPWDKDWIRNDFYCCETCGKKFVYDTYKVKPDNLVLEF